ncbi:hypothetical protein CTI12_AA535600 [Artemisia annua]|uniref:Transmembrane protein n=1 Tax=Artemisia annua TaxID=35608 RepID=A0A2U1L2G3_ARTAN|nr:hypothetical protein CTI12_AA535600 [Artemisia annua]
MVQDPTRMNHQTRVIQDLSSLLLTILRHPDDNMTSSSSQKISNSGLVWLMMGVSLALMVCGSLSFCIGFLLMPWVFFLVVLFYIVGVVSSFVVVFRAVFCHAFASKKGDPAWKLL